MQFLLSLMCNERTALTTWKEIIINSYPFFAQSSSTVYELFLNY